MWREAGLLRCHVHKYRLRYCSIVGRADILAAIFYCAGIMAFVNSVGRLSDIPPYNTRSRPFYFGMVNTRHCGAVWGNPVSLAAAARPALAIGNGFASLPF
jgi:hypothetical protein